MKLLRKNLLAITVLVLLFFAIDVSASSFKVGDQLITIDENKLGAPVVKYQLTGLYDGKNLKSLNSVSYSVKFTSGNKKNEILTGYCIDPNSALLVNAHIVRMFGDPSNTKHVQMFDAGILKMASEGYSKDRTSITIDGRTVSGEDFYYSTTTAIRAFSIGFFGFGKGQLSKSVANTPSAYVALAEDWSKELTKADYNYFKQNVPQFLNSYSWFIKDRRFASPAYDSNIMHVAKKLFMDGVRAAVDQVDPSNKVPTIKSSSDNTLSFENNQKSNVITINLKTKDFDSKGKLINTTLDVRADRTVNVSSAEYFVNDEKVTTLNNISLKDNPDIKVVFSITPTDAECNPVNYNFKYTYTDGEEKLIGGMLYNRGTAFNETTTDQRFLVVDPTPKVSEQTGEEKGTIDVCFGKCNTNITIPNSCIEVDSGEWVESYIKGPENIIDCIIGSAADEAGNPYKVDSCNYDLSKVGQGYKAERKSNSMSNVSSNPYCNVFCKEDYVPIKFSGIQTVNSGRYFKVGAEIKGTKTCYTDKINTEKYINDIKQVQEEMVTAYNNYLKWDAYSKNVKSDSSQYSGGYRTTCCSTSTNAAGESVQSCSSCCKSRGTCGGYYATANGVTQFTPRFNASGEIVSLNSRNTSFGSYSNDGGSSSSCSSCTSGSSSTLRSNINSEIRKYKDQMDSARSRYQMIINRYNNCSNSTGWDVEYLFNQYIDYSYEEAYYNISALTKEDKRLALESRSIDRTSKELKCVEGLSVYDKGRYETCSNGKTNYTVNRSYTICTTSGCSTDVKAVQNVRYVKRSKDAEAKYTTPEVFYTIFPSGNIVYKDVANDSKYDIPTELVDGLPVSMKTSVGMYQFKYDIKDLGEFYQNCTMGRLVGARNSVVNALTPNNDYQFTGEYVCHYKVNCPDCEFTWDFDDCTTGNCCVGCIFTIDKLQLYYRTISVNKFNPNNRPLGYNWNYNYKVNDTFGFVSKKADKTVNDAQEGIDTVGDQVYENEPLLKVILTPDLAAKIKKYNKEQINKGGYSNQTFNCYSYEDRGDEFKNVFCYSSFLDQFAREESDKFIFTNKRIMDERLRESTKDQNGYWKTYTESMPKKNSDPNNIGGPSWK